MFHEGQGSRKSHKIPSIAMPEVASISLTKGEVPGERTQPFEETEAVSGQLAAPCRVACEAGGVTSQIQDAALSKSRAWEGRCPSRLEQQSNFLKVKTQKHQTEKQLLSMSRGEFSSFHCECN